MNEEFDVAPPTWQSVVTSYLASIENTIFTKNDNQRMVTRESLAYMAKELLRMAQLVDEWEPFIASGDAEEVPA